MDEYAQYRDGVLFEIKRRSSKPEDLPRKGIAWYPVVREYGEPFVGLEKNAHVFRSVDPATLPPPVPYSISDRQFFQQLAVMKLISEAEAEDAVASGTLPDSIAALVEFLPEQARHPARMLLKGATVFERKHEMTDTIAWLYGFESDAVDELFHAAAVL